MTRIAKSLALFLLLSLIVFLGSATLVQAQTTETPVEIKMTAKRYEFEPKTITVKKGRPVRLLITTTDVEHGFAVEALGINQKLKANATTQVDFTPTLS